MSNQALVADSENDSLKISLQYPWINLIQCGETSYLCKAKAINLWGMEPEPFPISKHIVAELDFWALASFSGWQTMERYFQQPGIFSEKPFCMELFINLLLCIR